MRHIQRSGAVNMGGGTPYIPADVVAEQQGLPVGHYGNSLTNPQMSSPGAVPNPNTKLLPGQTMEDLLINLITEHRRPEHLGRAWAARARIEYFPLGMALVINQTPDVQEQVADLLDRRCAGCRTWKWPSRCGSSRSRRRSSSGSASTST